MSADLIQAQGGESRMIFGECASYGVMPTTPNGIVLYRKGGETFQESIDQIASETMSNDRNPRPTTDGARKMAGGFPFELAWQYALFFKHLLGGYTPAAADANGVFTEVFTVGRLPRAGLWFEKGFPDLMTPKYIASVGHKVGKFSYELKPTGAVGCSFDMPGSKEIDPADVSFDAAAIDLGCDPFNGSIATIAMDGSTVANITDAKFDYDNALDTSGNCIGDGGAIRSLPGGRLVINGTLTYLFEDLSIYEMAVARQIVDLLFTHVNGTGDGTAGNESMTIALPEVKFSKKTPTIKDEKGIIGEAPFSAFRKNSNSAMVVTIMHSSTVLHTLLAGA